MRRDQGVAHLAPGPSFLQQISQGEEVPCGLRHLRSLDHEMSAVHPVADKRPRTMSGTFALGNLSLVMREDVVDASAVDVDRFAQKTCRHGAALDMPSWASFAPGTLPSDGSILGNPGLPEGEVGHGLLFVFVTGHSLAGALSLEIHSGEFPVAGERGDPEIDRPILSLIGMSSLHQRADHRDHPCDLLRVGRGRIGLGRKKSEGSGILEEGVLERARVVTEGNPRGDSTTDRFIIHVREIHHAPHVEATLTQMPLEQVLKDVSTEVPDMRMGIDGRSAGVEGEAPALAGSGNNLLQRTGERVVNLNGHPARGFYS